MMQLHNFQILRLIFSQHVFQNVGNNLSSEVDYLNSADQWEAREEAHGAPYGRQLINKLGFSVLEKGGY